MSTRSLTPAIEKILDNILDVMLDDGLLGVYKGMVQEDVQPFVRKTGG